VARVFVSHASEDHLVATKLHQWLGDDGHDVFLDQDLRDGIAVGEEWEQRLYERLRWADAVVCLITVAYNNSAWCAAEVGIARSQGSRLLPVRAEPGEVHPLLMPSQYQYADLASDALAARTALCAALRRLDAAGGWGWPDGRSPFPGLRRFDTELHRVFFGRSDEVAALAARLRSPADVANSRMLLVVGPSGCGKSSLVRAGLLPVMALETGWHTLAPFVPGVDPVGALARELAHAARVVQLGWTFSFVRDRLNQDDGLAVLGDELLLAGDARQLFVAVDQVEELLTVAPASARAQFARLLRPALAGAVRVVGTVRAEFLGNLLASAELADLPARTFPLRPLRRDALAAVIEEPARLADIRVDPELVARLVADTETGEALPLLAFTLAQLSEGVGRGGQLSVARYEQLGGVQGALIRQADTALADALAINHRTRDQVMAGLLRLVTVDEEGRPTRWLIDQNELPVPVRAELEAFAARRLLIADAEDGGSVVLGVTHEAFLSAWPPLTGAITAAAAALKARRALELAATEWDDAGRPPLLLWERGQLAAAVEGTGARRTARPSNQEPAELRSRSSRHVRFRPGRQVLITDKVELSARARDFLQSSIRRDRSRRRRAVTVLSVLLVLAIAGAAIAVVQQQVAQGQKRIAQQQLRIATARQLITEAGTSLEDDPLEALQLGIAAVRIQDDAETRASLVSSLISTPYAGTVAGHDDLVGGLAFSPNGNVMVSCGEDNSCRVWNVKARNLPTPLGSPFKEHADVNSVAISPDGRILACALANGTVHLWSLNDAGRPKGFGPPIKAQNNAEVRGVAFGKGGTMVAVGEDGRVRVWDVNRPDHPVLLGPPLESQQESVRSIAISPDGRIAATGGVNATLRLWSLDRNHPAPHGPPIKGHGPGMVRSIAFSSDGSRLATASDDHTARVWDVADPDHPRFLGPHLVGHQDEVTSVAFNPKDRNQLVTASDDQTVRRWSVAAPAHPVQLGQTLTGAHDEVYSLAYTPDGSMVVAGIRDGRIALWNVASGVLPAPLGSPLVGHDAGVDPVVFNPSGDLLATASEDMTVKVWKVSPDPSRPSLVASLRHEDETSSAAFSPDQPVLVTGSEGTIHIWNVANRSNPTPLREPIVAHDRAVVSLAFCPGRDLLISGDEGGKFRLWNMANPKHPVPLGLPLEGNDVSVDSVACSPDGHLLAVAGTAMVKLWDIAQMPVPLLTLEVGHGQAVNSVAFSPDGWTLATASDDGEVNLFALNDRNNPTRIGAPLRAQGDVVTSVTFSPKDPRIMATASEDTTVQVWDLTQRDRPVPLGPALGGHQKAVNSVAISSNDIMATASEDQTALLWDLSGLEAIKNDPAAFACMRTGGGLNPDEWNSQIPALPYQKTCPG
jgi:WD40 repeat protein